MRAFSIAFLVTVAASMIGNLAAVSLVNNSRTVRRFVGSL